MHRRQLFALAGAFGSGTAASWFLGRRAGTPLVEDEAAGEGLAGGAAHEEDEEVLDPRAGLAQIIWSVDTDQPVAAITFDDGPDPEFTPRVLDILEGYDVKATFLAMGHNAEEHEDLLAEVRDRGHEIGHHSWRHLNLANISNTAAREEIDIGARAVEEAAGVDIRFFRPPRGRLSEAALRLVAKHGHDIVMWSVTRGPLAERNPRRIADTIVGATGPGDIILLHDGIGRGTFKRRSPEAEELIGRRSSEVEGLPETLERIQAKGIRLGTVSDVLAVRAAGRA